MHHQFYRPDPEVDTPRLGYEPTPEDWAEAHEHWEASDPPLEDVDG